MSLRYNKVIKRILEFKLKKRERWEDENRSIVRSKKLDLTNPKLWREDSKRNADVKSEKTFQGT